MIVLKAKSWDLIFYTRVDGDNSIKVYGEIHMDNWADFKVYGLLVDDVECIRGIDEVYIAENSDRFVYKSYLKQFL